MPILESAKPRLVIAWALSAIFACAPALRGEDWPAWRGPRGDGTSLETRVPVHWNGREGKGIDWKVEIPGIGHGSPVVLGDRIYLVSCEEETGKRLLVAVDARKGVVRFTKVVFEGPLEMIHHFNSRASSTPAVAEEGVYVAFLEVSDELIPAPNAGSPRDIHPGKLLLAAYDHDGELRWKKSAGPFISVHGFSTNPVLFEDLVIVNGDHDGDAYIAAFDRKSGDERWRIPRENKTRSYVTPIFREIDGAWQMMISGSLSVASYDPRTGKRIWRFDGPTEQFVASPVFDGERLFITAGYPEYHIVAIRPRGEGDITKTNVAWRTTRGAAYVPSPVLCGKHFVIVSDNGFASCFVAETGERLWMERLQGKHSASLVTAKDRVYFTSEEGVTTVVRPGKDYEVVATNELGERVKASPALSGGRIFLRGERHLFAIRGVDAAKAEVSEKASSDDEGASSE